MSTVLWCNLLEDGNVVSDQSDKPALHKHADKLDAIATRLGLPSFVGICDTTDARFNASDARLPEGMTSTDEVMAKDGAWMPAEQAETLLAGLLAHIRDQRVRFGLLSNDHDQVIEELSEALLFAKRARGPGAGFNFSIVT